MTEKKEKSRRALIAGITGAVAACLAATYLVVSLSYRERFFPNVTINGIDVSGMTADQVRAGLDGLSQDYALRIRERDDKEEIIYGRDFGLQFHYEDTLAELLKGQQSWKWGMKLLDHTAYELSMMTDYDAQELERLIDGLECADSRKMIEPKDAYLSFDTDQGMHIVPEIEGSKLKVKDLREQIKTAVESAASDISLEDLGLYASPRILQTDKELNEKCDLWKPYMDTRIVYHFGDAVETLDGTVFYEWMSEAQDGSIAFDKELIREYVRGLARKYNTAYSSKELETSYGETIIISAGPYGWLIDQPQETDALEQALLACESQDREPIYALTAASHTAPDYGDTYVEINLSAQHLFFYKEGELLVETDFVSGNESRGWATPAGAFPLTYKERNATLKGENYATPVAYWMPFNGNIGLHDSPWRKSFGKNIYKKNGSHGCINLPPDAAALIFENIEKGMPVLCYYLNGTEWIDTSPDPEPGPQPEPDPGAGIEPDPGADPGIVPDPGVGIEPDPGADPGIVPDPGVGIVPDPGADPGIVPDPGAGIVPDPGADPGIVPGV